MFSAPYIEKYTDPEAFGFLTVYQMKILIDGFLLLGG